MRITVLLAFALMSAAAAADRCAHHREVQLEFDGDLFESLSLQALAGHLEVQARDSSTVEVTGRLCASSESRLESMDVEGTTYGRTLEVTVVIPRSGWGGWGNEYAYVDVVARVPRDLGVAIRDSSGDVEIDGVHLISVNDSSGRIRTRRTSGDASIDDSSGDIRVRQHEGSFEIADSSGTIDVRNVTSVVYIPADSSGDIRVHGAEDVRIERDGSGDIDVEDVVNGVEIGSDGSGSIYVSRVGPGGVDIGSDGSGNVKVVGVEGDFRVSRKGSGNVSSKDVLGMVDVPHR